MARLTSATVNLFQMWNSDNLIIAVIRIILNVGLQNKYAYTTSYRYALWNLCCIWSIELAMIYLVVDNAIFVSNNVQNALNGWKTQAKASCQHTVQCIGSTSLLSLEVNFENSRILLFTDIVKFKLY